MLPRLMKADGRYKSLPDAGRMTLLAYPKCKGHALLTVQIFTWNPTWNCTPLVFSLA